MDLISGWKCAAFWCDNEFLALSLSLFSEFLVKHTAVIAYVQSVLARLHEDEEEDEDEEEEEEEEEEEDRSDEDSDEGEITYNRTLPATHSYLGEVDTVSGRTFLSTEGSQR